MRDPWRVVGRRRSGFGGALSRLPISLSLALGLLALLSAAASGQTSKKARASQALVHDFSAAHGQKFNDAIGSGYNFRNDLTILNTINCIGEWSRSSWQQFMMEDPDPARTWGNLGDPSSVKIGFDSDWLDACTVLQLAAALDHELGHAGAFGGGTDNGDTNPCLHAQEHKADADNICDFIKDHPCPPGDLICEEELRALCDTWSDAKANYSSQKKSCADSGGDTSNWTDPVCSCCED